MALTRVAMVDAILLSSIRMNFRRWEAGLDGQSEGTSIKRLF
uniref:Uncharacterized protein n=1 Tax=Vitis vinifera TaxID=29760 RepID=F6GW56_VITVI